MLVAMASAPEASTPRWRLPQMDGLRAIAACTVFVTHVGLLSNLTLESPIGPLLARMNVGVALFFVLSGFLLYRPFVLSRLERAPQPGIKHYAVRRASRILPAYWLALIVLGLLLPGLVSGVFSGDWWVYFGLMQVYSMDWMIGGIAVAWSIATEVAFYIVLPLIAWSTFRVLGRMQPSGQVRVELWLLLATAALAMALRAAGHELGWSPAFDNTLIGRWPWFAVGMVLAVASAARSSGTWARLPALLRSAERLPWLWWAVATVVLGISALTSVLPQNVFAMTGRQLQIELVLYGLFAGLLAAPLVFGDAARRGSPSALLASGPFRWVGKISYGIFLWHYPLIGWVVKQMPDASGYVVGVVSGALTLACASISWYLVERPVMRWSAAVR